MISVIVPCFNQASILDNFFSNIVQLIDEHEQAQEFVFVDDGSTDSTTAQLQKIAGVASKKITIVRLAKNYGQHNATVCGLQYATGNILITLDLDKLIGGALPQVLSVIALYKDLPEVLLGINTHKSQSFLRTLVGKVFALTFRAMFRKAKYVSSTRIISRPLAERIFFDRNKFIILDAVIDARANSAGIFFYNVKNLHERSVYKFSALLKLAFGLYVFYRPVMLLYVFVTLAIIAALLFYGGYTGISFCVAVLLPLYMLAVSYTRFYIVTHYKEKFKVAQTICK